MTSWVIFTDLDESLLDRNTYSCDPASSALEEIRRRDVPLVFCTSKTVWETRDLQQQLGIEAPSIIEGGGAICVPRGYFAHLHGTVIDRGTYLLMPLAAAHEEVLRGLGHIKEFTANSIRAFDDMTAEDISRDTGLPLRIAELAKVREFDEPFKFVRREAEFASHLPRIAHEVGLRVTRGGRYYHLHGDTDKGHAVHLLKALFSSKLGAIRTIGLGDSEMDMPMLRECDVQILVPQKDGTVNTVLQTSLPNARHAPRPGPEGWNLSVLETLAGR